MSDNPSLFQRFVSLFNDATVRDVFYRSCFAIAYAGMRARGQWESCLPRIVCFLEGFPMTLIAYGLIGEGSNSVHRVDTQLAANTQ